ncbi:MAG: milk-clotting protease [Mucilaginibacter sp.]|jgi:hypothetical protein|nr:milk-clotting protease [Mucilaginibacter sp.]
MYSTKKLISKALLICSLSAMFFSSCKKQQTALVIVTKSDPIPAQILTKINAAGFSIVGAIKVKEGYLVEGDIVLTDAYLNSNNVKPKTIITTGAGTHLSTDQYRVTNPVNPVNTTITTYKILISNLSANYATATDEAIARYNALNLCIRFQRITAGTADITITGYYDNTTTTEGSSGFPVNGIPYNSITLNTYYYGANPTNILFTASVIQHEIGHCIGMRHTDYADRSFSCGPPTANEGASTVGAVLIPGTPSGADAGSWMLACNDGVSNRTFNANDIIALRYLFPHYPNINWLDSIDWNNGAGSAPGSGTINSNPGAVVHVTVSAYGPGTLTNFTMSGAQLSGPMGNSIYIQNNSTTQTFTMPSSGWVTWSGYFQRSGTSGTGDIAVY